MPGVCPKPRTEDAWSQPRAGAGVRVWWKKGVQVLGAGVHGDGIDLLLEAL